MIYDKIAQTMQDALGGDYLINYANNHDTNWDEILPEAEDQLKYGVLRVDSGTTTQTGGQTIRVEQIRLIVAIPEDRKIFTEAVNNLRGLLVALNGQTITDNMGTSADTTDDVTVIMYGGDYHDASSQIVNGNRWWIAEVTFLSNFFQALYDSEGVSVSLLKTGETTTYEIEGIMSVNYQMNRPMDGFVFNGTNAMQKNFTSAIQQQLTINVVYLKNKSYLGKILDNETSLTASYTLTYQTGAKTRTLSNMILANLNENTVMGDIVKATITFITGA